MSTPVPEAWIGRAVELIFVSGSSTEYTGGRLEKAIEEWPASALRRVQSSHSAIILASESGLSMSRATPMPPS